MLLYVALVPQQAVRRLVAHLHPSRLHAVLLQQRQHVHRMVSQVAFHLFVAMPSPSHRNGLLCGIGPRVAIVEVNHHVHPQRLSAKRHPEHLLLAVHPTARIHPHTQADGTHLIVVLQQFQTFALAPLAVVELHTASLLTGQESHVGTLHEVAFCGLILRHSDGRPAEQQQRNNRFSHLLQVHLVKHPMAISLQRYKNKRISPTEFQFLSVNLHRQ